jgi:hypothetical protein
MIEQMVSLLVSLTLFCERSIFDWYSSRGGTEPIELAGTALLACDPLDTTNIVE